MPKINQFEKYVGFNLQAKVIPMEIYVLSLTIILQIKIMIFFF
jgi:hypothetical protein